MTVYATADQIAHAVVAAARLTGADPVGLYAVETGKHSAMARARAIAFVALCEALPSVRRKTIEHALGYAAGSCSNVHTYRKTASWWREDWIDEVVGAILAPEIEPAGLPFQAINVTNYDEVQKVIACDLATPATPKADEEQLRQYYRPAPKPKRSVGRALDLGEPVAGRSALDQRRAGVTPHYEDDDGVQRGRAGCIRKGVTLPRLKCLEKDF